MLYKNNVPLRDIVKEYFFGLIGVKASYINGYLYYKHLTLIKPIKSLLYVFIFLTCNTNAL